MKQRLVFALHDLPDEPRNLTHAVSESRPLSLIVLPYLELETFEIQEEAFVGKEDLFVEMDVVLNEPTHSLDEDLILIVVSTHYQIVQQLSLRNCSNTWI